MPKVVPKEVCKRANVVYEFMTRSVQMYVRVVEKQRMKKKKLTHTHTFTEKEREKCVALTGFETGVYRFSPPEMFDVYGNDIYYYSKCMLFVGKQTCKHLLLSHSYHIRLFIYWLT